MAEAVELALAATVSFATSLFRNVLDYILLASRRGSGDQSFQSANSEDSMGLKPPYDGPTSEQLEQLLEIYKKLQPLQERLPR
jgi:hypothetical protein